MKYLYRAVDSTGETIDFLLSEQRDAATAKQFLMNALAQTAPVRPRVINVDGHAAYPPAISQLKSEHRLNHCGCRRAAYLNNVLERDHRFVKKRIAAGLWFRTGETAVCTIAGYEAMNNDTERASAVGGQGRCTRADCFYRGYPRRRGIATD